jgi:ABC-type glutathione transport system ATPase component
VNSFPHEMSGGQQQRVMIAMAIACEPKLLIADEPTTALDVTIQKQILDLIASLQQRHHMSVLFITHDLGVVGEIADHVVVMQNGSIQEQGPVKASSSIRSIRTPRRCSRAVRAWTAGPSACRSSTISSRERRARSSRSVRAALLRATRSSSR